MIGNLPEISFVGKDAATIKAYIISGYETAAGRTLADGDPVKLFLETIASFIVQERSLTDYSAKQNLLAYMSGDFLDHHGAFTKTTRNPADYASCTVRFTLSEAQPSVVIIPIGTRVTKDGSLFFATTQAAEIAIGNTHIDLLVTAQTAGEIWNGIAIGEIKTLVDPIAFMDSVSNLTVSSGGADIEGDDDYRERIYLAPEKFSVAGPTNAYIYWAKTASQLIADVKVENLYKKTGLTADLTKVNIYVLMENGEMPTTEILNKVDEILNADDIRPLTDKVSVLAPEQVSYNISLTYYISSSNAAQALTIQSKVNAAIEEYKLWQKAEMQRDINPSELIARIMEAGAKRVALVSPTFTALQKNQVAKDNTVTITYGGLENG